jgi:DNA polymerase
VPQQKTARGRELIKLLSLPMADGSFCEDPALLEEMYDYCKQDVRTEQAVGDMLREPSETEWRDYYVNERINDRGIRVDMPLCLAAQAYAKEEEDDLVGYIQELTGGQVLKARGEKLKAWVVERLTEDEEALLVKYRGGERKLSLDKYNRFRLLSLEGLDPTVREVVECSDFAQRSSVGKFRALALRADPETHRVQGALMANGAPASGRYSSRGAQTHNFPRESMKDPVSVRTDLLDNIMADDIVDYFDKPLMTILSHMLRPALVPEPGYVFAVSDWSAIEGRVAPWLCNSPLAEQKLGLYRVNAPVYEITAGGIYNVDPDKIGPKDPRRQVGKVCELAFQFGGGASAFAAMGRNYGVYEPPEECERIKKAWRRENPWAEHAWKDIERAAMLAVRNPGRWFNMGRVRYIAADNVLCGGTTLFCELPDGRYLTYPDARIAPRMAPWGEEVPGLSALRSSWTPKADETEWPRVDLWGGLLFENCVQGTAASLLRWLLGAADEPNWGAVLHVHDEVVLEVKSALGNRRAADLTQLMGTGPSWANGLPLKAEATVMKRFGK